MKIERLELRAFGPFTDVTLELAAGHEGLHLVYGPNEAGKSTALRALKHLLFGIPLRCADDFLHPYKDLRIGGVLCNGHGQRVECIRRKAIKNDLLGPDDSTPLDPDVLNRCLGGIDRDLFENMFGIDHPALVRGGDEVVKGRGNLGKLLFAAGSGIAELRNVEERLAKEAADLFAPRATVARINKNLAELESVRKAEREAKLPSSEWQRHDKLLRQAREQLSTVRSQLQEAGREKDRLQRITQALSPVAKRRQLLSESQALGHVQLLDDEFADKRRETQARLNTAASMAESADEAIQEFDDQLKQLVVPEKLLEQSEVFQQLQQSLGSFCKGQRDLGALVARREQAEADARRILGRLCPDLALDDLDQLRLTKRQQVEIQNLGNRHEALVAAHRQTQADLDELVEILDVAQESLSRLELPRPVEPLESALRRVERCGPLEDQLLAARAELQQAQSTAAAELRRLPLWTGSLEELASRPFPGVETIDQFEAELTAAVRQHALVSERLAQARARGGELKRQLDELRLERDVPSEDELVAARRRREAGWRLVRQAWRTGEPGRADVDAFVQSIGVGADLAGAYEQSVRQADDVADRLRREADRVAARARLEAECQSCQRQIEQLLTEHQAVLDGHGRTEARWHALWQPLGVSPLSPREMRGWESRRQTFLERAADIRRQSSAVEGLLARVESCRRELSACLQELGEPASGAEETLAALVDRGQVLVAHVASVTARRARLNDELADIGRRIEKLRTKAAQARRAMDQWAKQWQAAVERLGLPADATPAQANEVLAQFDELFDKLRQASGYRERIEGILRESLEFEQQVRALAATLNSDSSSERLTPEELADRLIAQLKQATEDKGRWEALKRERDKRAEQREQARRAMAEAQGMLAVLCQEAGCKAPEALPEMERLSSRAKELANDIRHLDNQLLMLADGAQLDDFVRAVEQADSDLLRQRIEELSTQIEALDELSNRLPHTIAEESAILRDMDTSAAAAEAAERAQNLLAEIASDAQHYARLRLASAVLRGAIERYRIKNQGPVLNRASRLFAQLTAGSFAGLRAEYDDKGEPVLVGIRAPHGHGPASGNGNAAEGRLAGVHGELVPVEGMSDGTADQLYLALRLASLETYLDEKEPIPFIVDDILIKFDNERSLATLRALAQLSRRVQVIFFTHHEHLLELAEQHLDRKLLFTHRLPGRVPQRSRNVKTA